MSNIEDLDFQLDRIATALEKIAASVDEAEAHLGRIANAVDDPETDLTLIELAERISSK